MSKIKQLSTFEAQKIAAGQVVERPANIVKELVENAIDAHATTITIFIENGGKKLIRVVDNGCGMSQEDAQLSFAKHATSKITTVDQLTSIDTFGFRGEALASIAAVSKVVLRTKEHDAEVGTAIEVCDGTQSNPMEVGCANGTDIAIRDLFYGIPARAKFLKKTDTEWRHCLQVLQAFCLSHPHIHFTVYAENKQILNCPPADSLHGRCNQVWELQPEHQMLEVVTSAKSFSATGVVGNHVMHRYDRQQIMLFVNNRWVKNHQLSTAVCKGYTNVIPHGKYPVAVLMLTVDPELVDINIHPRKEEVLFAHPRTVETAVQEAIRARLEAHISEKIHKKVSLSYVPTTAPQSYLARPGAAWHSPFASGNAASEQPPQPFKPFDFDEAAFADTSTDAPAQTPTDQMPLQSVQQTVYAGTLIGQLHKTYILIEQEDGLFVIDQHAAHERILYEELKARFEQLPTIPLLFPERIELSLQDMQAIEPHLDLLAAHSIMIERSGPHELLVSSIPVHLKDVVLKDLITQCASWISQEGHVSAQQMTSTVHEKLRAQMACKAAVKAGDSLTREKMEEILERLTVTPNRFSCPHGRPTGWLLHQYDIEKKFRRRT